MFGLLLAIIYLAFVSLGLPDALLGAAWPTVYPQFDVPVSWLGAVSIVISFGTIASSLLSDRLTRRFGTGLVTAVSVATTAVALLGFSFSSRFWMLILWAIPYGLGAGGVDASLNNYVALHYTSRHMSWLHCMWGVGASAGPYIMGYAISASQGWPMGYRYVGALQVVLCAVLFLSLNRWKKTTHQHQEQGKPLPLKKVFAITGAKEVLLTFLCYCAIEQTAGSWASSYFVMKDKVSADTAASFASLFYIGLTVGRFLSGFVTMRLNDTAMVRLGGGIMGAGILVMLLPFGQWVTVAGLLLIGLGCAPIYPCIIHSTPAHFGAENSQAVIGVQMAAAYAGCVVMPPVFGLIAERLSIGLLPVVLAILLAVMLLMHERLEKLSPCKKTEERK